MTDYEDLYKAYKEFLNNDATIQRYWKKTELGTATAKDASEYANYISSRLHKEFTKLYPELTELSSSELETLAQDMAKAMQKGYSTSAYYSKNVQENMFQRTNIGMKVIEPKIEQSRITSMVDLIRSGDTSGITEGAFQNVAKQAASDTFSANARNLVDAGVTVKYIREGAGVCCDWCEGLKGEYTDDNVPDDFWKTHDNCSCVIYYKGIKEHWRGH